MERLEKGLHGLGGRVIHRLGSLALCHCRDNRAQWPQVYSATHWAVACYGRISLHFSWVDLLN
jgi:hypothetical protein